MRSFPLFLLRSASVGLLFCARGAPPPPFLLPTTERDTAGHDAGRRRRRRRAVVHVGPWKTGTTHVQAVLKESARRLRRSRVCVVRTAAVCRLAFWLQERHGAWPATWWPAHLRHAGITNTTALRAAAAMALREMGASIRDPQCDDLVLSCEELSAVPEQGLADLRNTVLAAFDDVVAVAFYRNLLGRTASQFDQQTKGAQGRPPSFFPVAARAATFNTSASSPFLAVHRRLARVLGLENVRVAAYDVVVTHDDKVHGLAVDDVADRMLAAGGLNVRLVAPPRKTTTPVDSAKNQNMTTTHHHHHPEKKINNAGRYDVVARAAWDLFREYAALTGGCVVVVEQPSVFLFDSTRVARLAQATRGALRCDSLEPLARAAEAEVALVAPFVVDASAEQLRRGLAHSVDVTLPWCELDADAFIAAISPKALCAEFAREWRSTQPTGWACVRDWPRDAHDLARAHDGRNLSCPATRRRRS